MPPVEKRSRFIRAFEGFSYGALAWFISNYLGLFDLAPFLRGAAVLVVVMAAMGALLGLMQKLSVLRIGVAVLFALWLLVAYTPLTSYLIGPLKVADSPQRVDAVVVLQAGIQVDDDFGSSTLERTLHGLELIQQGYAPRLILTETPSSENSGSHLRAASALMKNLRVHCPVLSVGPVNNTHDEAMLASQLAKQHGWTSILLVTSPVHSRRAYLTFRKTGLHVLSTPCRETAYDFENLSTSDMDGRVQAFGAAMREIIGLRTYRARGWA